jgi:hypothetical protein
MDMQHGDMDMHVHDIAVCQIVPLFLQRQAQNTLTRKKLDGASYSMYTGKSKLAAILYSSKLKLAAVLSSNESNHLFFAAI